MALCVLLDWCIEKKLMQQFTPMEETDESEVEIDCILDEAEGLDEDWGLNSVGMSKCDQEYS